jgi:hypothetical protein
VRGEQLHYADRGHRRGRPENNPTKGSRREGWH